ISISSSRSVPGNWRRFWPPSPPYNASAWQQQESQVPPSTKPHRLSDGGRIIRSRALGIRRAVSSLDDPHHVGHDAVQLEILRRIDGGDAGFFQRFGIFRR